MPWLLALTLVAPAGYADETAAARAAMQALEYDRAVHHWDAAIEAANTEDERVEAHLGAGIAARILGDSTQARLHFIYVLRAQPWRRLTDDTSPRVRTFFELVRTELNASAAPNPAPRTPVARSEQPSAVRMETQPPAPDPVLESPSPGAPPVASQRTCWGWGLVVLGGILFGSAYLNGIFASNQTESPVAPVGLLPVAGAPIVGVVAGEAYPAQTYQAGLAQVLGLAMVAGGWFWTEPVAP